MNAEMCKNKQMNNNLTNVYSNDNFIYIGYTTDGSGINHRKYNNNEPTVWAKESG